jgi:hypothetical protein
MRPIPIDDKRYCLVFIIVGCLLAMSCLGAPRKPEGGPKGSGISKAFNADDCRPDGLPRSVASP